MLNFWKKRKEFKIQQQCFDIIKKHLSGDFQRVYVACFENIAELSDMVIYGIRSIVKARIDESKLIHIKIEDMNGFLFEGFTQNYKWFLETFSFQ